jgi:hypothetical protein
MSLSLVAEDEVDISGQLVEEIDEAKEEKSD